MELNSLDLPNDLLDDFPFLAPKSFIMRIEGKNPNDPLLAQILPKKEELCDVPGFDFDPLSEKEHSPINGLIHKYYGRALLLVTNRCAINCRFCFRRHLQDQIKDWQKAYAYIRGDITINEVILSGGDPLMLKREELQDIIDQLNNILHIKRIRIHSRIPIVAPEKITDDFIQSKIPMVLVVHCNHPNEIDGDVAQSLARLQRRGIVIFNQSVLLKNINDDSKTLITLSEKLFKIGVIPYYLHILDKVKGAAHFYVDESETKKIYYELRKKLPGYLVPKLVVENSDGKVYV